jgi:hypothetical protein
MLPPGQSEADIRGYPAAGCLTPFLEPHLGEEDGDELVALEAGCRRTLGVLRIAWAISGADSANSARWVAARPVVRVSANRLLVVSARTRAAHASPSPSRRPAPIEAS